MGVFRYLFMVFIIPYVYIYSLVFRLFSVHELKYDDVMYISCRFEHCSEVAVVITVLIAIIIIYFISCLAPDSWKKR